MPHRTLRMTLAGAMLIVLACTTAAQEKSMPQTSHPLDKQFVRFSTMLTVRDLIASQDYYVKYFGFRVTESSDGLRLLERPGVTLYLVSESPPTPDKPGVTLAPPSQNDRPSVNLIFRVSDARATYAALAKIGLKFLAPPQQPSWGGWRCFAQDPDGYLIEVEQP